MELSFVVSKSHGRNTPPEAVFRAQGNLLAAVADVHNSAVCDLSAGVGFAHLEEAAVGNSRYFRDNFLEAMTYTLLDAKHVVALHAACLESKGNGFLLFGNSGAGKSSLAYACARRGWTYISDDCTFIPRRGSSRIAVGNPRLFRFRPAASMLFPGVRGPVSLRNGKPTMEINTADLPSIKTGTDCAITHLIFLNRQAEGNPATAFLRPVSEAKCWAWISQQNAWPAELQIERERERALKTLLGARALELQYTDCDQAVDALEKLGYFDEPNREPPQRVPKSAYYDHSRNGWVLSRYADVSAALHDQRLCPTGSRTENVPTAQEMHAEHQLRIQTLKICSGEQLKTWRAQFEELGRKMTTKLRKSARTDIIANFAEPWTLDVAVTITGAEKHHRSALTALARLISMASADPSNQSIRESAKAANEELARRLEASPIPMGGPAFVALSQTLPSFLANAWLSLLRDHQQLALLRTEPALMPSAIEELLRHAGLAHTVFRRALAPINLAGLTIAEGERVMLDLSSANRDPEQFVNPERLDLSRQNGRQFALGAGMHSCGGGALVKMLAAVATTCFVETVAGLDPTAPIEWKGGTGFRVPKTLYVLLRDG